MRPIYIRVLRAFIVFIEIIIYLLGYGLIIGSIFYLILYASGSKTENKIVAGSEDRI